MTYYTLRKTLLRIGLVWKVNAFWKRRRIKRQYQKIVRHYCNIPPAPFSNHKGINLPDRPRIFFIGTDEGQDYSGLLQGLERVFEVSVFTNCKGKYGQLPAIGKNWNKERIDNGQRLLEQVIDSHTGNTSF